MNKTTLEGLEEALERLEQIDGVYSWGHLLFEVRDALADHPMDYEQGFVDGVEAQLVEPVKQEPVAWVPKQTSWFFNSAANGIGQFSHIKRDEYVVPLYAAPVDAKAIRAEERKECISNCLIVEHAYKNAAMWNHAQGAEACAGYLEDTK